VSSICSTLFGIVMMPPIPVTRKRQAMKKESLMRFYRLCAALAALMLLTVLPMQASAQTRTHTVSAEMLISTYYNHINVDFQSGDFSDLSQFYAPNAVLKQSNPAGVTTVYKGLVAITAS
jgi:hypothetical protein